MPIYVYRCTECDDRFELVRSVKDHSNMVDCNCGGMARQVITPLHVIPDIEPYRSVVTGERIKGRAHHKAHLKDHGLVEIGNEKVEGKATELPPAAPDIKRAIEELKHG